jgi:hypothetical protein
MDNLLEKLEQIKQKGAYSLTFFYGEGTGADDTDVPMMERSVKLICEPVGYLGSMRAFFIGTVKEFLEFDFATAPTVLNNPPKREEYEKSGLYCWGTERSIESFKESGRLFPF